MPPKPKNGSVKAKKPTPKKQRKITPTYNQQIAFKKLSEIVGKKGKRRRITLGKILRESGYSVSTSKTPAKVTKRKGWKKLMAEHYPDKELVKAEGAQLHASGQTHYVFPLGESDEEIKKIIEGFPNCKLLKIRIQGNWKRAYYFVPDNTAIGKSLDRIYKLKNKYPAEKHKIEGEIKTIKIINYGSKKK